MWFEVTKSAKAVPSEQAVRRHSLRHLAEVFCVSEASLSLDARFGKELKANPASDFKVNQFDIVGGDIKDVADKRLLKEMAQGKLVIQTVGDYCEHMVRCSSIYPEEVVRGLYLQLPSCHLLTWSHMPANKRQQNQTGGCDGRWSEPDESLSGKAPLLRVLWWW